MAATQRHLDAIRNREWWALSAGESTRMHAHLVRGGVQAGRGKSTGGADRAMDRIWAEAEQRVTAEIAATAQVAAELLAAKAKARAEKRAQSIWW